MGVDLCRDEIAVGELIVSVRNKRQASRRFDAVGRRVAVVMIAAVAVVASGCGSAEVPDYPQDGTNEEQIRAVVGIANAAIANKDGHLICREVLPYEGVEHDEADIEKCGRDFSAALEEDPENWPDSDLELSRIEVDGDHANATGSVDGIEGEYEFVHERGRWRMVMFN